MMEICVREDCTEKVLNLSQKIKIFQLCCLLLLSARVLVVYSLRHYNFSRWMRDDKLPNSRQLQLSLGHALAEDRGHLHLEGLHPPSAQGLLSLFSSQLLVQLKFMSVCWGSEPGVRHELAKKFSQIQIQRGFSLSEEWVDSDLASDTRMLVGDSLLLQESADSSFNLVTILNSFFRVCHTRFLLSGSLRILPRWDKYALIIWRIWVLGSA